MPYEVTLKQIPPRHVAEVRRHAELAMIDATIQEAFKTLVTSMDRAEVEPVGPPFVMYERMFGEPARTEVDVCIPVGYGFRGDDEVEVAEVPGSAVAATLHRGPYQEVGQAYAALDGWIREHSLVVDGPAREVYLTDPEHTPDPADHLTEVEVPVR